MKMGNGGEQCGGVVFGLGNRCSIRLSYGTDVENLYFNIWHFESAGPSKPASDPSESNRWSQITKDSTLARPQGAALPVRVLRIAHLWSNSNQKISRLRQKCAGRTGDRVAKLFLMPTQPGGRFSHEAGRRRRSV